MEYPAVGDRITDQFNRVLYSPPCFWHDSPYMRRIKHTRCCNSPISPDSKDAVLGNDISLITSHDR
jgi:hypothetical protein